MKQKVLVLGASGFIGRNVAEELVKNPNYEVVGTYHRSIPFTHPKIALTKCDLTDPVKVREILKGVDIVVQAAATTSGAKEIVSKPYYHVTDNALMNTLIFREAFEQKIKHVIFFSCTVMYPSGLNRALKEIDFNANEEIPKNYFGVGWTKVYLEKMAEFYSRICSTKFTVIRHSNIYGPYDKFDLERSHVFGATVTKVLTNENGKITVWGDGSEERDLLYVSDLVDYVKLVIEKQKNPFILQNVGLGSSVSVTELVKKIIHASGKKIDIEYDKTKPSLKTKVFLDISKAKAMFGWAPKVTLQEGIEKTIHWHREHHIPTITVHAAA